KATATINERQVTKEEWDLITIPHLRSIPYFAHWSALTGVLRQFPQQQWLPSAAAMPPLRYNDLMPEVKPFRLTESVKAAG
ncbi:MAG TPA: hypothetical protein VFJ47_02750, partial [Terriglobales bacterium]|nr:hypothetical protein [Terriglobales bacterium]